jgi:hypothetical protein
MILLKNFSDRIIPISQRDPRWAAIKMGSNTPYTIGSMGCLMTCVIMISNAMMTTAKTPETALPHFHKWQAINPITGLMPLNGLGITRAFPETMRYKKYVTNQKDIRTLLDAKLSQGIPIVIKVDTDGPYNHWVVATKQLYDTYEIVDPLYGDKSTIKARYGGVILEALNIEFLQYLDYPQAIDLSYANPLGPIAYENLSPRFGYAYIKASEGRKTDERYYTHVQGVIDQKIPYSPYHFLRPASHTPIKDQVKAFRNTIALYPRTHISIIDYETIAPAPSPADLAQFINEYEQQLGETIAIYSRANTLSNVHEPILTNRPIFQAHYETVTPMPLPYGLTPSIWQCGQAGILGYDGKDGVDINYITAPLDTLLIRKPTPTTKIDLLPYIRGPHLSTYIMRMGSGDEERYQYQWDENDHNTWYIVKNNQWEKWRLDSNGYIRLCMDTSPGPENGVERYYVVTAHDKSEGGIMFPRYMSVTQTYTETPNHTVEFYEKGTGKFIPLYSGENRNRNTLISISADMNTIEIGGTHESHEFTIGVGRTAWKSEWGSTSINNDSNPGTWIAQRESVTENEPLQK